VPADDQFDPDTAVDALYARPLDEFIAARDAAVRQATDSGDRLGAARVKRLPKPSVAAWVINQVAREHPDEIAALADLGDELRAATQERDRGRIRALDHLRRERTEGLVRTVREAGEVGGRQVSSAVLDRLTETLTAAVMDPDAAAAVRAGRLSRALQHVGFGIVDEQGEEAELVTLHLVRSDAGAGSAAAGSAKADGADADANAEAGTSEEGSKARRAKDPPKAERRKEKPSAADADQADAGGEAEAERAAAEQAVEETSARVDQLEERRDEIRDRLRAADAEIERGEDEVERLDQELARLAAERDAARQTLDDAKETADEARTDLEAVEDELDDAVERAAEARRRRREARGR
jgi:outer membrane murein-binding lipoprotein Lpp